MRNSTIFETAAPSTTTTVEPYKPKTGEILVKDSLIYSQKPESHHLRRQLWPIMEETMHTIAHGMATGAKILKHMVRPKLLITGDPSYFRLPNKAMTIKNVYLGQPSSLLHKKQAKPYKIVKEHRPVRTTTEDYLLRFNADDPSYTVRTRPLKPNPFSDMGIVGYKHFEKTILRDLEKKEERKVEASMSLPDKSVEQQLLNGTPFADWKPIHSHSSTISPPLTEKPHPVSKLNTNTIGLMVKPIHELVDESPPKLGPNQIESSLIKTRPNKFVHRKPLRPTVVATVAPTSSTISPPVSTTTIKSVLDIPNYPDYFIKQNKHLTNSKPRHFTKSMAGEKTNTDKTTTVRHEQNIGSSSEHREIYANPESITSAVTKPPRRQHRHRPSVPSSDSIIVSETKSKKVTSNSATSSRGKIKFGDRSETE